MKFFHKADKHKRKTTEAIALVRTSIALGTDLDAQMRAAFGQLREVRPDESPLDVMAEAGGVTPGALRVAIQAMVDGVHPRTYHWLGFRDEQPFYTTLACLYVTLERERAKAMA